MPIRRYGAHVLQLLLPDIADPHSHPYADSYPYAYTDAHAYAYTNPHPAALMPLRHLVHRRPRMHTIRRVVSIDMPVRMLLPDAINSGADAHADSYADAYPHRHAESCRVGVG